MKKNNRTSIRMRILRLALISVGVAILSLSVTLIMQINYVGISSYKREIRSLSGAYTSSLTATASSLRLQIESAAANAVINQETDPTKLREALSKLAETTSFHDFSISELDGKTLNNTDISDREYFQEALNGKTYISRPVIRKTDNSLVIMSATKMPNNKIIYGALSGDALSAGLNNEHLGENGNVYIIDKYGDVMASSDASLVGTELDLGFELVPGEDTFGHNMYYDYMLIDGTDGWGTVVVGNMTDAYVTVNLCLVLCAGVGILLCIIAIIVSLRVSRRIVEPIITTTERLELLSKGDLTTPVQVFNRRDETENLSFALQTVCDELTKYVSNIVSTTGEMAQGNFSYQNRMDYVGDFESIPQAFQQIHNVLSNTIELLTASSNGVQAGSEQLAAGTQLLAEGSARQATAVEGLSLTVDDISEGLASTAKSADEARDISGKCADLMSKQDETMSRMVSAMKVIEEKSEAISVVIKTIEDIAFQTNILSLNASIEAARAGDAGKGFAVVASEVGNLAQKSAQSANSTKELIASTLSAVADGAVLANESSAASKEVTALCVHSAELIQCIADATTKQSTALTQVVESVTNISQVVQTNSATAEESAASCEELSAQTKMLNDQISRLHA